MFIALLGVASYTYRYVLDQRVQASDWHVEQLRAAEELRFLYLEYEHAWKDILLRGHDPQSYHTYLSNFYELERHVQTAIDDQARAISRDAPSMQALNVFEDEFYQAGRLYRRALRTYNEDISDPQFAADAITHNTAYDPLGRNIELIETLEASRQNNYQQISGELQRFEIAIVLSMLFLICVFLLTIYYLTSRYIITSINDGISLAENISRGDLKNNIKIESSTSEVNKLLLSLRQMQVNINRTQRELIEAKEEAEQSNKAKSVFLSRMSHELRTPLHAILGFGQILQMRQENLSPQQQKNIGRIMEAGQHLLDLINEVLDLARIENNKLDITIDDVELTDIVSECISLTEPMAQQKQASVVNRIADDQHYVVRGDFLRVKQALINLMTNAIIYGPEHGQVVISCSIQADKELRLEVTDDGPGIPLDRQHQLFEPFKRLDKTQFTEGIGIGLALTRQLVELMHGEVGVVSEPGKGSTFWIQLALSDSCRDNDRSTENERAQG